MAHIGETQNTSGESEHRRDGRNVLLVVFAVIAAVSVGVAIWALSTRNAPSNNADIPGNEKPEGTPASEPVEPLKDQIALPQFAWLYLKAGETEQELTFANPEQNFAWLKVSLVLDGQTLWESKILRPGETSEAVVLSRPLDAGDHEAHLVYSCYADGAGQSSLNGADSPVTLKVYKAS